MAEFSQDMLIEGIHLSCGDHLARNVKQDVLLNVTQDTACNVKQ